MLDYERMLTVRDRLNACKTYSEKLDLWDAEGISSYGGAISLNSENRTAYTAASALILHLKAWGINTEVVTIVTSKGTDFWDFFMWCLRKASPVRTVMNEAEYWEQIQRDNFPEEYLERVLTYVEQVTNQPQISLEQYTRGNDQCIPNEVYKTYCFRLGVEDFKRNRTLNPDEIGYYMLHLSFHSLRETGEIFRAYYDGIHSAEMLKLLRQQKGRLDRREDITRPVTPPAPPRPKRDVELSKETLRRCHAVALLFRIRSGEFQRTRDGVDAYAEENELKTTFYQKYFLAEERAIDKTGYQLPDIYMVDKLLRGCPLAAELFINDRRS